MSNPIDIVDTSVLTLPHLELSNYIISLADAVAVHPGYQQDFPSTVPDSKELKETGTHYNVLSNSAKSGDSGKRAERDAFRPKAVQSAALLLTWAAMRSIRENDPSLIANLGVAPKKKGRTRSKNHALVEAPKEVQVKHSQVSGKVILNVSKVKGSATYLIQACQGDPTREESWSLEWPSTNCRGIELTGLEPGKLYHFRVRCFGHAGHGPWSSIVSLMVI